MTTCVNQEKKGYAGKAVSATLAGVLAVGMVPAAAFAEAGGDGAAEDASVSLLAADTIDNILNGKVASVVDSDNEAVSDFSNYEVAVGSGKYIKPATFTGYAGSETISVLDTDGTVITDYKLGLFATADISSKVTSANTAADTSKPSWAATGESVYYVGDLTGGSALTEANLKQLPAGKYYVVVMASSTTSTFTKGTATTFANSTNGVAFSVVNKSLKDATLLSGEQKTDTTFTYAAESGATVAGKINLLLGDSVVTASGNYSVAIYKTNSSTPVTSDNLEAGNYVAQILGQGDYAGSRVEIPFTVQKLDLSTADIVLNKTEFAVKTANSLPTSITTVAGATLPSTDIEGLQFVSGTLADGTVVTTPPTDSVAGTFTYKVTPASTSKSVTGEKTIEVVRYDTQLTSEFTYTGFTFSSKTGGYDTDINTDAFDASKISVKKNNKDIPYTVTYKKVKDGVSVDDTNDNETLVDVTDTSAAGHYYAIITAKAADLSCGGVARVKFEVESTTINANQVFVTYGGKLVTSNTQSTPVKEFYTGSDFLGKFAVTAKDAKGKDVASENLVITAKNSKGKEVDQIVDAGDYTLEITAKEGSNYTLTKQTIYVSVAPVEIDSKSTVNANIQLAGEPTVGGQKNAYAYTGSAVVPTFEYDLTKDSDSTKYSKSEDWTALPSSAYTVTYFKATDEKTVPEGKENTDYISYAGAYYAKADSATAAGDYVAVLKTAKGVTNYVIDTQVAFKVTNSKYFIDVPVSEWYYDTVYKAANLGYMTGYDGTKYFGPNDYLTRAQAVVVLYKMAGGTLVNNGNSNGEGDAWNNTYQTYASQFADVDQSGWYAQALGWAVKAGIVTGTSDTTFEPNRDVTRQEFVLMLQRYAKANNDDVTADASVLKTYADATSVDTWATDGVAWAVSNKIAGVGTTVLNPTGSVKRAEVAAMAIRYQPEKLDTNLLNPNPTA
jgi:hypothetical protein